MSASAFRGKGATVLVALLLATLATLAPILNTKSGPPRSVFLHLSEDKPRPRIALVVDPLPSGGFRLDLSTEAFRFTEICLAEAAAIPVGHAHIHVDGVKVASAYQPVVYLDALTPGKHRITAVLRGQDHRALVDDDGLIMAELHIVVPDDIG
ncbi:MAG: hypothetical protein AAGK00_20750 [Pseudomonadota bacterium]